jgi:hypothetical protein
MMSRTTVSQLKKAGPGRPSSFVHRSLATGRTLSGLERSDAVVKGERLRDGLVAIEDAAGGTELRAEGIELEARDEVSRTGEGDLRNFFTSCGTAYVSSLRFDPDATKVAGVSSRATTLSLPSPP